MLDIRLFKPQTEMTVRVEQRKAPGQAAQLSDAGFGLPCGCDVEDRDKETLACHLQASFRS
jgi:hypothetical protein